MKIINLIFILLSFICFAFIAVKHLFSIKWRFLFTVSLLLCQFVLLANQFFRLITTQRITLFSFCVIVTITFCISLIIKLTRNRKTRLSLYFQEIYLWVEKVFFSLRFISKGTLFCSNNFNIFLNKHFAPLIRNPYSFIYKILVIPFLILVLVLFLEFYLSQELFFSLIVFLINVLIFRFTKLFLTLLEKYSKENLNFLVANMANFHQVGDLLSHFQNAENINEYFSGTDDLERKYLFLFSYYYFLEMFFLTIVLKRYLLFYYRLLIKSLTLTIVLSLMVFDLILGKTNVLFVFILFFVLTLLIFFYLRYYLHTNRPFLAIAELLETIKSFPKVLSFFKINLLEKNNVFNINLSLKTYMAKGEYKPNNFLDFFEPLTNQKSANKKNILLLKIAKYFIIFLQVLLFTLPGIFVFAGNVILPDFLLVSETVNNFLFKNFLNFSRDSAAIADPKSISIFLMFYFMVLFCIILNKILVRCKKALANYAETLAVNQRFHEKFTP